ncbi:unnamed protein product, partial [marine sediment metagenome]
MRVGMITPDLGVYGSVRRFVEIGNEMTKRGIDYILYIPAGKKWSGWIDYKQKYGDDILYAFSAGIGSCIFICDLHRSMGRNFL